jgi:hypothetical protein
MVAIADAIIKQRTGKFDPSTYRDRYQEALRELIEAKVQGRAMKPRTVPRPTPVIDLMAALKRSLGQEWPAPKRTTEPPDKPRRPRPIGANQTCCCRLLAVGREERGQKRQRSPPLVPHGGESGVNARLTSRPKRDSDKAEVKRDPSIAAASRCRSSSSGC